jgi:orotidine-5'-phosphate decarboxylase
MLGIPNFADNLCAAIEEKKSVLCAGLDPQLRYMPPYLIQEAIERYGRSFRAMGRMFYDFNRQIIDAVADVAVCVKPNLAFYEAYGAEGIMAYEETIAYARSNGLLVIADGKRGDGGDTADSFANAYLGKVPFFAESDSALLTDIISPVRADCLTIHGYIGEDCVSRFVKVAKENGTGIFVVTKTSFKPNSVIEQLTAIDGSRVWQKMAEKVREWGEGTKGAYGLRNVGVVVGATYNDAVLMREILPNSIFLKPGYGGQGASADEAISGIRPDGLGVVVNNSRNLTFAWQNMKGKYHCDPEKFDNAARAQAKDDRDALVHAARQAGNWPF